MLGLLCDLFQLLLVLHTALIFEGGRSGIVFESYFGNSDNLVKVRLWLVRCKYWKIKTHSINLNSKKLNRFILFIHQ